MADRLHMAFQISGRTDVQQAYGVGRNANAQGVLLRV